MIDTSTISITEAGELAFKKFWQVKRTINLAGTQELKPLGIGMRQAFLILTLDQLGTSSQAALARKTNIDPAATGRAIETMKRRGWIEQHDSPSDRRCWEIKLTDSGKALAASTAALLKKLETQCSNALTHEETITFIQLLDKILSVFPKTR